MREEERKELVSFMVECYIFRFVSAVWNLIGIRNVFFYVISCIEVNFSMQIIYVDGGLQINGLWYPKDGHLCLCVCVSNSET